MNQHTYRGFVKCGLNDAVVTVVADVPYRVFDRDVVICYRDIRILEIMGDQISDPITEICGLSAYDWSYVFGEIANHDWLTEIRMIEFGIDSDRECDSYRDQILEAK